MDGLVDIAARHHLYSMGCLRYALVLRWLLARHGIYAQLRFGVKREAGNISAHAWLEYAGKPIGKAGEAAAFFVPLRSPEVDL